MMLALERESLAQTWEGPWDWSACVSNPCPGTSYPEFAHASLIPTGPYRGKVLLWRRQLDATCAQRSFAYVFDPLAPTELRRNIDVVQTEFLCSGASWDPNGRLVVVGGNVINTALLDQAYRFEPGSLASPIGAGCTLRMGNRVWQNLQDMLRPRWYPTILALTKATIHYDASTSCSQIDGGAHLVLGGPSSDAGHAVTWSTFELLPYGSTQWACPVDWVNSAVPPAAPARYAIEYHTDEGTIMPPPAPWDGKLSSYPRAFQLSNGDVIVAHDVETHAATTSQEWFVLRFNQGGTSNFEFWRGLVKPPANPGPNWDRNYGPAVLMHMQNPNPRDRVIAFGGANGGIVVNSVQEFQPHPSPPPGEGGPMVNGKWNTKANMWSARDFISGAVALPDGTILVCGGTSTVSPMTPVARPEIYDPGLGPNNIGSTVPMPVSNGVVGSGLPTQRMYHSFALLLPDGSVFLGGGETPSPQPPGFAPGPFSGEIFQPAYMPQTTGLDMPYIATVGSEQPMRIPGGPETFDITVENCKSTEFTISGVVLTRPGAVTHSFDNDQRYIELVTIAETQSGGGVDVTVKSLEDKLDPPGWYMLWVIVKPVNSSQKLPTHAEFVRFY